MLTKDKQAEYRSLLFRHLDGLAIAPTAYALHKGGIATYFLKHTQADLAELTSEYSANDGYLNVALRLLSSQGWLNRSEDHRNNYALTASGTIAFKHFHIYEQAVELLKFSENFHPRKFEIEPFIKLEKIAAAYSDGYELIGSDQAEREVFEQMLYHIEGVVVGPSVTHLAMGGMFHKYFMETRFKPEEFHQNAAGFGRLLDIFVQLGWFSKNKGAYEFTLKGLFFARRAAAYGVTVSYIPTFRHLDDLLFGDPEILRHTKKGEHEQHVDRAMNVWGSGGAHSSYFKVVDEIFIEIFNQPIADQPKGVLDMGCGNGAFLEHIFNIIERFTLRGKMLDEYPLILVGADYNEEALNITKANLIQSEVWAKVVWGDIGRPDKLAEDLRENYNIDLSDLLNVRTFLDHNRIWEQPIRQRSTSRSTGAYVHRGKLLNNADVEQSVVEHFEKWSPYVKRHGLLLIELHTIAPQLVADNIGKTAVTAYDATHGYSDQYIIELDIFLELLEEAGLEAVDKFSCQFPDSELAAVSINLFRA